MKKSEESGKAHKGSAEPTQNASQQNGAQSADVQGNRQQVATPLPNAGKIQSLRDSGEDFAKEHAEGKA